MEHQLKSYGLMALQRAVKPLVRIALRLGITASDFNELSKESYVECARADYGLRGRPTNLARVALLTGLSRKECSRLKLKLESADQTPRVPTLNPAARVMAAWNTDAKYSTAGEPDALPRIGPGVSLASLIAEHVGDIPEGAVVAELNRVEALEETTGDGGAQVVRLKQRSFLPAGVNEDKLRILANQYEDLGETICYNLGEVEQTRMQRYVVNDNIPIELVPRFQELATALTQSLLERLDAWLSSHEFIEEQTTRKTVRTGMGVYFFEESA